MDEGQRDGKVSKVTLNYKRKDVVESYAQVIYLMGLYERMSERYHREMMKFRKLQEKGCCGEP